MIHNRCKSCYSTKTFKYVLKSIEYTINCEVELMLIWSKNCALVDMTVNAGANPAIVAPSAATFKTRDTKLYVQLLLYKKKMTQNF